MSFLPCFARASLPVPPWDLAPPSAWKVRVAEKKEKQPACELTCLCGVGAVVFQKCLLSGSSTREGPCPGSLPRSEAPGLDQSHYLFPGGPACPLQWHLCVCGPCCPAHHTFPCLPQPQLVTAGLTHNPAGAGCVPYVCQAQGQLLWHWPASSASCMLPGPRPSLLACLH